MSLVEIRNFISKVSPESRYITLPWLTVLRLVDVAEVAKMAGTYREELIKAIEELEKV